VKVSVNDIIIKAVAVALKRVPEANASYTPEGIAMHKHADIAVAVAIDGGLITPIVRAAETKGLAQISAESEGPGRPCQVQEAEARGIPGRHLLGQ
jgi:pyruvate dehydrogenase E2 component (dihydrolipoamide acetyltransferase)